MIITISGKAESGKDFCAKIMQEYLEEHGYRSRVLILHQADYLKYICKTYFGWDGTKGEKGRQVLQYVGTDLVRTKYPNYWIDATLRTILILEHMYDYFIIPDCRFSNEIIVPKVAEFDVCSVLVTRPGHINSLTPEQRLHLSETALDNFDFDYTIVGGEGRDGAYQPTIDVLLKIMKS
jgi:hypothetical protein